MWKRINHTAAGTYSATALAFLASALAARELGPHSFGMVVLAVAVTSLIGSLLDVTLEEAVVHHGFRALEWNDLAGLRGLIRTAVLINLLNGIVVFTLVVALAPELADVASSGRLDPNFVVLAALIPLVSCVNSATGAVVLVGGRPDLRGWLSAATNAARLAGVLVALPVGTPAAIIVGYFAGEAVGALALGFTAWRVGWRRWAAGGGAAKLSVPVRELVRFGAFSSLTTTMTSAWSAVIPLLLGRVAGATAVGVFNVALFPVILAWNLTAPIRLVLLPKQAELAARGRIAELRHAIRQQTLRGFVLSIPCVVIGWFALPWLLPLIYGSRFSEAVSPARILLVGVICSFSFTWYKSFAGAVGRPELRTALALAELVLMAGLIIAIGGDGLNGPAIAYVTAALLSCLLTLLATSVVLRRLEAEAKPPVAAEPGAAAANPAPP